MNVVYERCAGLDVHQKSVVACVRVVAEGRVGHEVRTFSTMTSELLALADWLAACGCTHVAMESTGVFWKPVWHVLEENFTLVLANHEDEETMTTRTETITEHRRAYLPAAGQCRDLTPPRRWVVNATSRAVMAQDVEASPNERGLKRAMRQ